MSIDTLSIKKKRKLKLRKMSKKIEIEIDDIPKDTVIIEISGGVLVGVHNVPNDYILFDWDGITQDDVSGDMTKVNEDLLEAYLNYLND